MMTRSRLSRVISGFFCTIAALAMASAGGADVEVTDYSDPGWSHAEDVRLYGPVGSRHIIASVFVRTARGTRMFTLQRLSLSLINDEYPYLAPYPARHSRPLAYMVVESDPHEPGHDKLLWLYYGGKGQVYSDLLWDLTYDPLKNTLYVVRLAQGWFPEYRVDSVAVDQEGGEVPRFDPSERDRWPKPSAAAISTLRLDRYRVLSSITCFCDGHCLFVCGTGEEGVSYRLDLLTLKWYELALTAKEVTSVAKE